MGIFNLFKKKKQEQPEEEIMERPSSDYPILPMGMQRQPMMPTYPERYPESDDKEFQVLSSKLDALNAKIDMLNQRLANLERLAGKEEKPRW